MKLKYLEAIVEKIDNKIKTFINDRKKDYRFRMLKDCIKYQEKLFFVKEININDKIFFIKLKGEIDLSAIPITKNEGHCPIKGNYHVMMDFNDVEKIDSVTISELVQMVVRLKAYNKKIAIINATARLKTFIDILRVSSIIKVYDSEKEAVEALA